MSQDFSLSDLRRILREIEYINGQFQNLRTYIVPDPKASRVDLFYFVMFPADGSLADKPIVGKMFFPLAYPLNPPVLHVFPLTQRYNVDAYHMGDRSMMPMSSMCFDILTRKDIPYAHGIWEKNLTLASVFASLLQVLVSYKVKQQGSHDYEITEAVSMQKMIAQHVEIDQTWAKYNAYFPHCPPVERSPARKVKLHDRVHFARNELPVSFEKGSRVFSSNGFRLREADFSLVLDLSDFRRKLTLEKHRYNFVVSVILANSTNDPLGKFDSTILVRNGITGTAAKKLAGGDMRWFYHGKPLVDFQKIYVTVAHSQITLVVEDDSSELLNIHGDTVLSYLTEAELGHVSDTELFYLNVYVEAKQKLEFESTESEKASRGGIFIRLNTDNMFGFVHPSNRYLNSKSHLVDVNRLSTEKMSVGVGKMALSGVKDWNYLTNLIGFFESSLKKYVFKTYFTNHILSYSISSFINNSAKTCLFV
jgi:ubiquitin-protein ligase